MKQRPRALDDVDIPRDWARAARQIAAEKLRRLLVIGATDRGKSTLCGFLARELAQAGGRVAFVDADLGQKDLGPPATVSLGYLQSSGALADAELAALYFVGALSPAGHFLHLVVGAARMATRAEADFVVIDTTGLVRAAAGRRLKTLKIDATQPDAIIAIDQGEELDALLNAHRHQRIFRLKPSKQARAKTSAQRADARAAAFRSYFAHATRCVLERNELIFQRSLLFNGRRLRDRRFVYAERSADEIVAVGEPGRGKPGEHIYRVGFEQGLLCGVADEHGELLGLAVLQGIDFRRGRLSLHTPAPRGRIRVLQFGELYLRPDGEASPAKPAFVW